MAGDTIRHICDRRRASGDGQMVAFAVGQVRAATRNHFGSVCVMQITFNNTTNALGTGATR